jgi:hypothetical protein
VKPLHFSSVQWRKSSQSGQEVNSDCVEVADLGIAVGVRDSKNPNGPKLAFSRSEWKTFTERVLNGRLDLG